MDRDTYISRLDDIIQIKSENGREKEVAKYIQQWLNEHDINSKLVEYEENRSSLVAEINNGEGKTLGITGHLDVVTAGDESEWTYPPYEAHIEDGKMYGRGTSDMKSGVAALVFAFISAKESEDYNGTIRLLLTVGEEVGELGAHQLSEKGYADDLDALLIAEPLNDSIYYAHLGSYNYTVQSTGVAAHSALPQHGVNAINPLAKAIIEINKQMEEVSKNYENKELGSTLHNITLVDGGTQINSLPSHAEFSGNIRSIPEFNNEKITKLIQSVIDDLNQEDQTDLELVVDVSLPPMQAKKDSDLVQTINKHVPDIEPGTSTGTTDAAPFFQANSNMDVAIYGPGILKLVHKIDEYIEIDNYIEFIELYQEVIKDYLK